VKETAEKQKEYVIPRTINKFRHRKRIKAVPCYSKTLKIGNSYIGSIMVVSLVKRLD
jgi:hypothetical protein